MPVSYAKEANSMRKIHLRAICAAGVLLAGAVFASAQGTITEYPIPTPGGTPFLITSGLAGWITNEKSPYHKYEGRTDGANLRHRLWVLKKSR